MPSASSLKALLLLIFPFLFVPIVHSEDGLGKFCTLFSKYLDSAMNGNIISTLGDYQGAAKTSVAYAEYFATGMHEKMGTFSQELAKSVSGRYSAKFRHILNEEAVHEFERMFKTKETEMAKNLKTVLTKGTNAEPGLLANIFAILDNLTLMNIEEVQITNEFGKFFVDLWKKVKDFVHHLKRELIYAQSAGIIGNIHTEFQKSTEKIKEEFAHKFSLDDAKFKSLKKIVKVFNQKVHERQYHNLIDDGLAPRRRTIGTEIYDKIYHDNLTQRMDEAMRGKKGMDSKDFANSLTAQIQQSDIIGAIEMFFDELENRYMATTNNVKKNFVVEYHEYLYVYDLLKNAANELSKKLQILVEKLLAYGRTEMMTDKYEEEKKVVYVLVEDIVKPLLMVISMQMGLGNGQTIEEQIGQKLAIPEEMFSAEVRMISDSKSTGSASGSSPVDKDEKFRRACRQYRIRINAIKVLVIYERLNHFYEMFKHGQTINPNERAKMAKKLLNGELDEITGKLRILPEHFGQFLYDEMNKKMKKGKERKGRERERERERESLFQVLL